MQELGKYLLPGINIYQGKFANTEQCILKSDKTTPFSFKLILGDTQVPELMLTRFLNLIKRNNKIYKTRNFPDEKGRRNQQIILDHFLPGQGGVVFILPMATESLRKSLQKRYLYFHAEFDALTILTQLMMSYKTFYTLQIPYKVLNPGNILKFHNDYVLIPPSTLLNRPEVINADSNLNDYDYLYTAPEILKMYSIDKLGAAEDIKSETNNDFYSQNGEVYCSESYLARFEAIVHKQDIWSMGVIFFRLLFGCFPFQHKDAKVDRKPNQSFLKPNWSNKEKFEECTFRWYWYYRHIMANDLIFPQKNLIHKDIIDLLRRMLEKDPVKRISYSQMKNHPFMKYYLIMHKKKLKGVAYKVNDVLFQESKIMKEKEARKAFKMELKNKLKREMEKNKERRKTLYEKHRKAKLERKRAKTETNMFKIKEERKDDRGNLFGGDFRKKNVKNDYDIDARPSNDYGINSGSKQGIGYLGF